MGDVNVPIRRFQSGGVLKIIDGATTHTAKNLMAGSVRVVPGMYNAIEHTDRGTPQPPVKGDGNYSTIEFRAKGSTHAAADDLYAILINQTNATDPNLVKVFSVEIDIPDAQGASTGERLTVANCFVVPGSLSYQEGAQLDELAVTFRTQTVAPGWTTY